METLKTSEYTKIPRVPGVYLFKNRVGSVIYVGKAKDLRSRVGSYFTTNFEDGSKTKALITRIVEITYLEVETEFDALILEAELIKKFRPKYNIIYKDDKTYLYIVIRNEWVEVKGRRVKLSKVLTARKTELAEKDIFFGPFPDGTTAKYIVKTVRKIFPYRDCSKAKFNKHHKLERTCLYGDIGICGGPCVKYDDKSLKSYRKNIKNISSLLSGESSRIVNNIESKMIKHSKNQEFELAAKYRDILNKFIYIRGNFRSPEDYIQNPYLVQDLHESAITDIAEFLPFVDESPHRIECYDISNISGKEAVGSMVVAINGRIEKSEYRKFKIKLKDTPDDFEMMREVLYRRLKREASKNSNIKKWGTPDLIVVDGGKGQVSAAHDITEELGVDIPIIGIAKKEELLVYKMSNKYLEVAQDKNTNGMKLLINLRNESHRFAQSYHHKLRSKSIRRDTE